mgnify:CR=1 FL=1
MLPPYGSPLNPADDPLTLAEGHQAGVFNPAGAQFMAFDQSLPCHALKGQGEGSPRLIRHPQRSVDVGGAHPILIGATAAVIHRQNRQDRPLVSGTESVAGGQRGKHVQWCELLASYRQQGRPVHKGVCQ